MPFRALDCCSLQLFHVREWLCQGINISENYLHFEATKSSGSCKCIFVSCQFRECVIRISRRLSGLVCKQWSPCYFSGLLLFLVCKIQVVVVYGTLLVCISVSIF